MKYIFSCFVKSLPLAAIIIGIGYLYAHVLLNDPQKLNVTLFVLGTIPIVLFLPSRVLGHSRGVLFNPQIIFREFRKVDETLNQNEKNETKNRSPALIYVIAGILTWLFSWVVY